MRHDTQSESSNPKSICLESKYFDMAFMPCCWEFSFGFGYGWFQWAIYLGIGPFYFELHTEEEF